MKKNLSIVVTVSIFVYGLIAGYHSFKARADETAKRVEKLEDELDKTEEKVIENEKVDVKQTVILDLLYKKLAKDLE